MNVYHMKKADLTQDAYVVAPDVNTAHALYIKKYGEDTDYILRLTCGGSACVMEEKDGIDAHQ